MTTNLLFISIGDNNYLNKEWLSNKKKYDIYVFYYGDNNSVYENYKTYKGIKYLEKRKGSKFQNFLYLFTNFYNIVKHYERFFILDENIVINLEDINELFDISIKYKIKICSPSFNPSYNVKYNISKHVDGRLLTYTNTVDINAMIFSKDALMKSLKYINGKIIDWGINVISIFANGVGSTNNYAIIHKISCINLKYDEYLLGVKNKEYNEYKKKVILYYNLHKYKIREYKTIMISYNSTHSLYNNMFKNKYTISNKLRNNNKNSINKLSWFNRKNKNNNNDNINRTPIKLCENNNSSVSKLLQDNSINCLYFIEKVTQEIYNNIKSILDENENLRIICCTENEEYSNSSDKLIFINNYKDYISNCGVVVSDNIQNIDIELIEKYGILYFKNIDSLKNLKLYIVKNCSLTKNCGYCIRTQEFLQDMEDYVIALNPLLEINAKYINNTNNIYNNRNLLLFDIDKIKNIIKLFNIKEIILPSDCENFLSIYNYFKENQFDVKYTYEMRGLWFLTAESNYEYKTQCNTIDVCNPKKIFSKLNQFKNDEIKSINYADRIIFITDEQKDYCINELKVDLTSKPNEIIYNCASQLNKIEYNNENKSIFTIGYFGSIAHYEGIQELIDVISELSKTYKIKLLLIGKNNVNVILNENVEYIEWLDKKELLQYYNKIDLYCIPRLPYKVCEIISPIKPFDVLYNKIPLLMSDCDTLKSISNNGKNCMLFNKGNKQDLYNKIEQVIINGYDKTLLENGYNFIMNERIWDIQQKKLRTHKFNFNLPERNDNEIRLIYYGTLCDEENTLEIIEEFQKIHKERPEVILKIVYDKIIGNEDFKNKVNDYIKNGVEGITFKYKLNYKDACYEIATSDIGICWQKPGWGDNGEVSKKMKEYKLYELEIINDFKIKVGENINFTPLKTEILNLSNKCVVISKCLKHFTEQYYKSHNPSKYNSNLDCVFFGMYNEEDCINFKKHKGKKYILWGGSDLRFVDIIKKYYSYIFHKNIIHIAISKFIFNKLFSFTDNILYLKFELIDNANISSFYENIEKNQIYIYTAPDKRRAKMIYGYDLYNPIVNYFTNEKFLIANNQSYKYSEMKKIYSDIKLGIRTSYFDGNANTVQELATNGIYTLNNSDVIGSIPYIEDIELLKHQVSYLLKNLTIPDKKLYISSQIEKQTKYFIYNNKKKYNIYILYSDKPFLSDNIGGAAIIDNNNVYYNNIFINDCFDENNNYISDKFLEKYNNELKINNNRIDFYIDKWNNKPLFYPSRDYDFVFYRCSGHIELYETIFNLLPEPKIWSHTYNKNIWSKNIIGFQTETSSILADMKYLQNYDTDGTLNYKKDMIVPKRKNFIMYQSIREKTKTIEKLNLKSKYNTNFIIGIIGTIYKYTYPWSHLKIIDKLRNKYPESNIQLIIMSHTICEDIPKKDYIHFINLPKKLMPSYLNEIDIILDTWINEQIVFGGSNKLLDCISNEIPVITSKTFAHIELLGKDYKLMHPFQATEKYFNSSIENDIQNKIEYCMNIDNYNTIKKYLFNIKNKYNYKVVSQKYSIQFNKFYSKNILIICPDINIGGVVTYTLNMIHSLKKFNLYLCIENKNNISEKYYNNIKSYIKELSYDELENTDLYFNTVICNSSPIKFNDQSDNIMNKLNIITGNLIYITHMDVAPANPFINKYIHLLDKIITVNNLTIKKLSKKINIDESKFYCIPPCSDFIHEIQPKKNINKIIGYFGRVNDIKQPKFLIKCFDKIIKQFPNWKLYIVGPSIQPWNVNDIKKNIQNAENKELLERNVVLVDKNIEDEEEKMRYYKLFDILVSTTTIEGFPFVVSESLRMGTPVIITNVGGNKDCIKSGYNGDILNFKGLYTDEIYNDNIYIKLIKQMYEHEQYNLNEFEKVITPYLTKPEKILEMSKNALESIKYKYNNIQFKNKLFTLLEI
jgi:glycosyltransferase involved in cell wall biosynthesis